MSSRQLTFAIAGVLLCLSVGGCEGPLPTDEEVVTSALLRSTDSRPYADANVTHGDCCNATWTVEGGGRRHWSSLNEGRCNTTTDYIWTADHSDDYPYYAGTALEMDLSALPNRATVAAVTAFVCARPHVKTREGNFKGHVNYWDPDALGERYFYDPDTLEDTYVPAVGWLDENRFSLLQIETKVAASTPPSNTGKTPSSGMRVYLNGSNLDISQIFLRIAYDPNPPVPPKI